VSRSALSRSPVPLALAGLALATVPAGSAAARPPVKPYTLTATQERTVLRLVDDVCGDTWCEGDHAFRFHRFSCDPRRERCALAISIAPYDEQPRRWRSRSLRITGFPRYADMVRTGPDGHRALQDPFYEAVGTAVRAAEASVR
jgi:hypothetical protein